MPFHDLVLKPAATGGFQPNEVAGTVHTASRNGSRFLRLRIGATVARRFDWSGGDCIGVKIGSGSDMGQMRLQRTAQSPLKLKARKKGLDLYLTIKGIELSDDLKFKSATSLTWNSQSETSSYLQISYPAGGNFVVTTYPPARVASPEVETSRPNGKSTPVSPAARALAAASSQMNSSVGKRP